MKIYRVEFKEERLYECYVPATSIENAIEVMLKSPKKVRSKLSSEVEVVEVRFVVNDGHR